LLLGRIIGSIVSTAKHPAYAGRKLMMVELTTASGEPTGTKLIAVDAAGAGPGDCVLVSSNGRAVADVFGSPDVMPVRDIIVGIVDRIDL
jgi:microcompartment protein CcmK/EutM